MNTLLLALLLQVLPSPSPAIDSKFESLMATASLSITNGNMNPVAPMILTADRRNKTQCTLRFSWSGPMSDLEVFQVMRRVNGITESGKVVNPFKLKQTFVAATKVSTFEWVDRKLDPLATYSYSIIAITDDGTSLESNALTVPPAEK